MHNEEGAVGSRTRLGKRGQKFVRLRDKARRSEQVDRTTALGLVGLPEVTRAGA